MNYIINHIECKKSLLSNAADNLSHLCICHAIYDLNMHKPYSIPDILRMNDFSVEVAVKHQHFANQFGRTNI